MPSSKRRHSVSVLLTEEEFTRFARYCDEQGFKKSTLVAKLIREHLDNEGVEAPAKPKAKKKR